MPASHTQYRKALLREKLKEGFLYVYEPTSGPYKQRLVMQNPHTGMTFIMPARAFGARGVGALLPGPAQQIGASA